MLSKAALRAVYDQLNCAELSESSTAGEPFALLAHGRYQHSRHYLESALSAAGLILERVSTETLRYERQDPVIGLVAVAHR